MAWAIIWLSGSPATSIYTCVSTTIATPPQNATCLNVFICSQHTLKTKIARFFRMRTERRGDSWLGSLVGGLDGLVEQIGGDGGFFDHRHAVFGEISALFLACPTGHADPTNEVKRKQRKHGSV